MYIVETLGWLPVAPRAALGAPDALSARVLAASCPLCSGVCSEACGAGGGEIRGTSSVADGAPASPASTCNETEPVGVTFLPLRASPAPSKEIPAATMTITAAEARRLRRSCWGDQSAASAAPSRSEDGGNSAVPSDNGSVSPPSKNASTSSSRRLCARRSASSSRIGVTGAGVTSSLLASKVLAERV